MSRDTCLGAVLDELDQAGIPYSVVTNKHHKVLFTIRGKKCMQVVPATGSDHRGMLNARAMVRRTIREALNDD